MLVVVQMHRFGINERLQGVIGVGEGRQVERAVRPGVHDDRNPTTAGEGVEGRAGAADGRHRPLIGDGQWVRPARSQAGGEGGGGQKGGLDRPAPGQAGPVGFVRVGHGRGLLTRPSIRPRARVFLPRDPPEFDFRPRRAVYFRGTPALVVEWQTQGT